MSYERGAALMIEAARTRDGKAEADLFIGQMEVDRKKKGNLRRLADIAIRMEEFSDRGTLRVPMQLNQLTDDLHEIKAGDVRLPFYYCSHYTGKTVRLTHGFLKKSQKAPRKEIGKGLWIIREDGLS